VPIVKETKEEVVEVEVELDSHVATEFRGLAARANYLSLDRPDIQFATKEICREMARPTEKGMLKMKRLARYLLQFPRVVLEYNPSVEECGIIDVYSDSDWAGCVRTRKSTSGGIMMLGDGVVKTWSSTQTTIAQSSGEAEYYALVRAAAEGLGMQSVMQDLGWKMRVRLHVDSSAAKSIASRVGLGRVRHLEVKFLWLQAVVRDRRLEIRKVHGTENPADVLTKPKSAEEATQVISARHMKLIAREESATADSVGVAHLKASLRNHCRKCGGLFFLGVSRVTTMC